jgi:FAD/FMN-containing dehydrogenase
MTSATDMNTFGETFGGEILRPGDDGYDTARALWNGDHDRRPALIARPSDAAQVASAIRFGRESNLELAIRGGGHSFAGHGVCDDGLMIDLSAMRAVTVDPVTRRARCGGGTTWADLDAATQEHGLAVTGGVISHTGVAGLTLGGGIGWLTRLAGLSCDNLVSAQVVTAFGGSRAAKWVFNIAGLAPERALLDVERGWVRDYYDALLPHASGSGTYINFLNDADESRVRASYGAEKYDRLARIKAEFDPDNVFHRNANIRPATTGASA